jgi:hypothetical protein
MEPFQVSDSLQFVEKRGELRERFNQIHRGSPGMGATT